MHLAGGNKSVVGKILPSIDIQGFQNKDLGFLYDCRRLSQADETGWLRPRRSCLWRVFVYDSLHGLKGISRHPPLAR